MEQLAQFFKALSDETRLRIVLLLTQEELCVCDLMEILGEPQSKISRHLAYLKHSGITENKRIGVWMYYRLKDSQNGIFKAQINLLKKNLSIHPIFKRDAEKLQHLKRKGRCKAMMAFKFTHHSQNRISRSK